MTIDSTVTIAISAVSLLFSVIGYLLKAGIDGVRAELKGLREDLQRDHDRSLQLEKQQEMHRATCEERHKRIDYELLDLKGRG